MMKSHIVGVYALLSAVFSATNSMASDSAIAPVVVSPLASSSTTASGQPIALPQKNVQVLVSRYQIAPGAKLPVHKHPFPRYAYVQSGKLQVTNVANDHSTDYQAGDFIVEMIDQWHWAENIGTDPVQLLVIDQVEEGAPNTVLHPH